MGSDATAVEDLSVPWTRAGSMPCRGSGWRIRSQGPNGYFALPMLDGQSLAPFEFEALKALNSQPSPHAFDFHAGVLTFRAGDQSTECRAVFSVPSRALHFTGDSRLFHIHVAFLALVKDDRDQVVRKISRDLLFRAPAEKRAEFEQGEVTVTLPLFLPAGRYRVEAVAKDVDGEAASTRKIALVVPSAGALSDIVLVRSLQPAGENRDATDPLQFLGGKITPEMNSTIVKSRSAAEGIYFALYPGRDAKPDVRIVLSRNGELVTAARPDLPPAEADGSFRVWSPIPFGGLAPGVYEIKVTVAQGGATVRRTMAIEVELTEAPLGRRVGGLMLRMFARARLSRIPSLRETGGIAGAFPRVSDERSHGCHDL